MRKIKDGIWNLLLGLNWQIASGLTGSLSPKLPSRVDRAGKSYTGVLCGLGWHPASGAPILPEHDIELAFDVQFTVEDIVEVRGSCCALCDPTPQGCGFLGQVAVVGLSSGLLLGCCSLGSPPTGAEEPTAGWGGLELERQLANLFCKFVVCSVILLTQLYCFHKARVKLASPLGKEAQIRVGGGTGAPHSSQVLVIKMV